MKIILIGVILVSSLDVFAKEKSETCMFLKLSENALANRDFGSEPAAFFPKVCYNLARALSAMDASAGMDGLLQGTTELCNSEKVATKTELQLALTEVQGVIRNDLKDCHTEF